MVKFSFLGFSGLLLVASVKGQDSSSVFSLKQKIDSVRNFIYRGPSTDLLPAEFNETALENEYYCDRAYLKGTRLQGQISVLRLRNNHTLIYETFYKPYDFARIQFHIGNYRISDDTIYIKYKPLLEGKKDQIYVSPIIQVSWIPPYPPEYLLIDKESLFDPIEQKPFRRLKDKQQFIF